MTTSTTEDRSLRGYTQVLYWKLTDDNRRMLFLQLLALVMLPVAWLVFVRVGAWFVPDGAVVVSITGWRNFFVMIASLILMIIVHEAVHGLFMRLYGARPRFDILWHLGAAYATAPGYAFTRNQFIVIALAPLLGLSIVGVLLFAVLPPGLWLGLLIFLIFNVSGAVGDLWMTALCLRYPPSTMIMDEQDGIRVFVPES